MENLKELPLEVRLSAYLDGQLDGEDAGELEALLETDSDARDLFQQLKAGSDFGNKAFEDMLNEPVPLHLLRGIKAAAAPAGAARQAANSNVASFFRFVPQAIAASAVLLLAGGYSGYFIGKHNAEMPMEITETSGLEAPADAGGGKTRGLTFNAPAPLPAASGLDVGSIVGIHDVYSKETARLVEITARDADELKSWLGSSAGVAFSIPDLSPDGLVFEGGRLVVLENKPAAALFYRNLKGEVIAIYLARGSTSHGDLIEGPNEYLSGTKGDTAWFVAGPKNDAALKDIAGKASAAI